MENIRIGQVSSVDYDNGMVQVLYTDRDGSITKALPVLTFNDEYKMPQVGSYVLVAHLSNGAEAGYVLGNYWNTARPPASSGKGVYRKEYGSRQGQAYMEYKGDSAMLEIHSGGILLSCSEGSITAAQIISAIEGMEQRLSEVESRL